MATIYHLLGIDPHMTVPDRTGRPFPIAHGGEAILPALEQLRADASWETALLALHNMVNVVILSHAITGGRAYLGSLEQNFGCVNVLDVGLSGHDWIVRALNICPEPTHYERTRSHSLEIMAEQAARRRT